MTAPGRDAVGSARAPEEVDRRLEAALTRGDLDACVRCFEPGAVLVLPGGESVARGHAAIREALRRSLAMRPRLVGRSTAVLVADGVALVISRWSLRGTAPDGTMVRRSGTATSVVRRRPDGTWRYVIDNPGGVGARIAAPGGAGASRGA